MATLLSPEILKKLWKSRRTMLEVLRDRGYPVKDSDFVEYETFVKNVGNNEDEVLKDMTLRYERNSANKIIVLWLNETTPKIIKEIHSTMVKSKTKRAIIVIDGKLSPVSKGTINSLATENIHINVYPIEEAQYNIMKHTLVPKHRVCTFSERKKILEGYYIGEDEIPCIKMTDPAIRHIGAIKGQIIAITRESESQPGWEDVSYRIVARYPRAKGESLQERVKRPPPSEWVGHGGRCWKG